MNTLNKSLVSLVVFAALSTQAHAGIRQDSDITSQHQQLVSAYAERHGLAVPEIEPYAYGMKLDVAQLVRISPAPRKACKPVPQLMTYLNASGVLKTVQYRVFSECRNGN